MADVLIRGVPVDDLDVIRSAAAEHGTSLQRFPLEAVTAQAVHLRRQAALVSAAQRLGNRPGVPDAERAAVLEAVDDAQEARADAVSRSRPR